MILSNNRISVILVTLYKKKTTCDTAKHHVRWPSKFHDMKYCANKCRQSYGNIGMFSFTENHLCICHFNTANGKCNTMDPKKWFTHMHGPLQNPSLYKLMIPKEPKDRLVLRKVRLLFFYLRAKLCRAKLSSAKTVLPGVSFVTKPKTHHFCRSVSISYIV